MSLLQKSEIFERNFYMNSYNPLFDNPHKKDIILLYAKTKIVSPELSLKIFDDNSGDTIFVFAYNI